jgi:hypothetical protein
MKRLDLILLVCLGLLVMAGPVQAQQPLTLSSLDISLWPEYDRPDVLVIYRGQFAADTPLPVAVELRLPANVGQPNAVAYVGEDGQRYNQPYTTRVDGDWLVVSFELSTTAFQIEYYEPLPVDASGQRDYTFTYTADYAVDALSLDVQVPPKAEGLTLDPPADSTTRGSDGLDYQLAEAGAVAQGETRSWTLTYKKADSELTRDILAPAETTTGSTPPSTQNSDNSTIIIFAVSFVALIAVGVGAFWLGKQTLPATQSAGGSRSRSKRRGSGRESSSRQESYSSRDRGGAFFCHQCGAALRSDSEFCHKCGAQVRE